MTTETDADARKTSALGEAKDSRSLATLGFEVVDLFEVLADSQIRDFIGIDKNELYQQHQRFDLWAVSIGLHQRGHASLDYRFRDAPDFFKQCLSSLDSLAGKLRIRQYCSRSFSRPSSNLSVNVFTKCSLHC